MDHVEALNALKVYKDRMKFVDKAMEALEASAELTMNADAQVKTLNKQKEKITSDIRTLERELADLARMRKDAEQSHNKQVRDKLDEYERLSQEEVDKYEALKMKVRGEYDRMASQFDNDKKLLSSELDDLKEAVRLLKNEYATVKAAKDNLLKELGIK